MRWSGILAFIIKEFKELVPPTVFFAVGFNIIALTMQLVLDDYFVRFASFIVVTSAALVVGKAVLVANALPFLGRFDRAPLIQPILFKTAIYFAVVLVVQILERIVEYLLGGGTMAGISVRELAPFCCRSDLDLRPVPDLCHHNGAEHAARRRRTR
jgi:hypothetical protein